MSVSLQRLRKRAAEFEQKKQFDRALEVYVQILDEGGKDLDDEDVPLFNRVGDMLMRKGSVTEALGYYERAVDVYAERGYLNNAIALCSKILRQSPGRAAVYYKLARISARKGFKSDARKNFLEYADRMQKLGMAEEAFRALKEFASLYPDQDDVRLILAELLSKENRKGEALEQLQSLYEKLQAEGRAAEARATVDRMRAIDPTVTPREGTVVQTPAAGDLVFLDLTDTEPLLSTPASATPPQPASARAPVPTPVPALTGLSITFFPDESEAPERPEGFEATAAEIEPVDLPPAQRALTPMGTELVVEPSVPDETDHAAPIELLPEPDDSASPVSIERVEDLIDDLVPEPAAVRQPTPRSVTPLSTDEFGDMELDDVPRDEPTREHDLALPGELPSVTPDAPVQAFPTLDSDAALEDARTAAEDAADLVADITAREAAHSGSAPEWPASAPTLSSVDVEGDDVHDLPDEELLPVAEPPAAAEPEVIPDDFLTAPPSFGTVGTTPTEYAFPPLPGLDDSTGAPDESTLGASEPETAIAESSPVPHATITIGSAESHLRSRLEIDPENWQLRRQLAEALLDAGDRDSGLYELELAMTGYELGGDLSRAQEVVDEILRVVPGSVSHHQKRVEYAVRSRDRQRLTTSYLELADALFRSGAADKAVAVYSRVLEHDAGNARAEFALATLAPDELVRLKGLPVRPERWSDELAAIHGRTEALAARAAVAGDAVDMPDESAAGAPEERSQARVSEPSKRVRFASIELPVPDWGEGVRQPETESSLPEQAHAGESAVADTPGAAAQSSSDPVQEPEVVEPTDVEPTNEEPTNNDRFTTPESMPAPRSPTSRPTPVSISSTDARRPLDRPTLTPATRGITPAPVPAVNSDSPLAATESDFIDLGEWLRTTEPPRSTRMQVEDPKPSGDEQADFEEMLRRFKRGVAANVEAEDYDAHYDLGVAYKEMGLVDEAIAEFQKALRGVNHRVRSYEALGQCFVEKRQFPIAAALLQRATEVPGSDDQQLVGVLYLLGFAREQMGSPEEALPYYLRVLAVDIEFRDVAERVAALGNAIK